MSDLTVGVILAIVLLALWIPPIVLGIRIAKKKNRSPHWMWFGFHPFFGWVAFAVLASLPPLKECSQCAEKVKAHAKICPYCMTPFQANTNP
jgi:hypothetical protein